MQNSFMLLAEEPMSKVPRSCNKGVLDLCFCDPESTREKPW